MSISNDSLVITDLSPIVGDQLTADFTLPAPWDPTVNPNATFQWFVVDSDGQVVFDSGQSPSQSFTVTADYVGLAIYVHVSYTIDANGNTTGKDSAATDWVLDNSVPVLVADAATATQAGVDPAINATGNVLSNDTDANNDTLTVIGVRANAGDAFSDPGQEVTGAYGKLTINSDGSYQYVPLDTSLAAGASAHDVFNYQVKDGRGATVDSSITVTVQGSIHAPGAQNDSAAAYEQGADTAGAAASGSVLANDNDVDSATHWVTMVDGVAVGAGGGSFVTDHGTLTIQQDGSYVYDVNNANPDVNALNDSDTLTDKFNYTISNAAGATSTAALVVTIHGANDAAVITGGFYDDVTEAGGEPWSPTPGTPFAGGYLFATDPDSSSDFVSQYVTSGTGFFHLSSGGQLDYLLDNSDPAIQALPSGGTGQASFDVYTVDGTKHEVTITIHGTNDAPHAWGESGTATEAGVAPGTPATGSLFANAGDPDAGDTLHVADIAGKAAGTGDVITGGLYGTLTVHQNGDYQYQVDDSNPTVNALPNKNAQLTDAFTYTIADSHGLTSSTATLNVTVQGANDAPVTAPDTNSAQEVGTGAPGGSVAGNVLTNDIDNDTGDSLHVTAIAGVDVGSVGAPTVGAYGALTLQADGGYVYTPGGALASGATGIDTFTYTAADSGSDSATGELSITVHGANDAPVAGDGTASAFEAGVTSGVPATGNVADFVHDPDFGDTLSVAAITGAAAGTVGGTTAGAYGTLTMSKDGTFSYVVDDASTSVNALNSGGSLLDTFSYTVADAHGLQSTADLKVTIHGANDAAVVSGATTGSVTEAGGIFNNYGGTPTTTGALIATDPDDAVASFKVETTTLSDKGYGSYTVAADGTWSYTLDDTQQDIQALKAGETTTDTFNVVYGTDAPRQVTITIHGNDDSPVAVVDAGSATEAGTSAGVNATGNVLSNDTDVDAGDGKHAVDIGHGIASIELPVGGSASIGGDYGTLTLGADGAYSYAVDNANSVVNALGASGTLTDVFSYHMADTFGRSALSQLTITIHGANDAPVAVADTNSAQEAGAGSAGATASGDVLGNDSDVDTGDSLSVTAIAGAAAGTLGGATAGAYGTLTLQADGNYLYVPDGALASGASGIDTFTYTVADKAGATQNATLSITVYGTNDAPSAGDATASAYEAGTAAGAAASGGVLGFAHDPDIGDTLTVVGVNSSSFTGSASFAGAYGMLTIAQDGTYSYVVDDASLSVNSLGSGGSLLDTFSYTVADAHGLQSTADLKITIHGANDAPQGAVAISGTPTQGQVLTADTSGLSDPEGLGTFAYQWYRGATAVGTNSGTYTPVLADVGATITVKVSYTDGGGAAESVTAPATANIAVDPGSDSVAPTVNTFSPGDASTSVAVGTNIVLTFSEDIVRGTGSIVLKTDGGTVVETFDAASSHQLSISGGVLTIDPTNDLAMGTHYVVEFASGTVTDTSGNAYAGTTSYDFATTAAPVTPITPPAGGSGNQTLTGTSGDDVIDAGRGHDVMVGLDGNDTYYVDNSHDQVVESAGQGRDLVISSVSFVLGANVEDLELVGTRGIKGTGNSLDNHITGNSGKNTLDGGLGADVLTGGLGADKFVYNSTADSPATAGQWDVITDFNALQHDRIDLSRIDADVLRGGNQKFTFIGAADFSQTNATGQVRFDSATHMLYASTNADANAEFAIQLTGVTSLSAHDLAL